MSMLPQNENDARDFVWGKFSKFTARKKMFPFKSEQSCLAS